MRTLFLLILLILTTAQFSCGSNQISEEAIRKSYRFYDAATIEWSQKNDQLAAIRHLTRSLDENPKNADSRYLLGTIRLGRGELKEAEMHLLKAVEYRAEDPTKKVEAQNTLGVVYVHLGRYEEAIKLFQDSSAEVLNRAPWLAFGNLGWAYTETEQYDEAISAIKRALFDQPKFCVGLYRLGNVYYKKGEYDLAKERLVESISVPNAPECQRLQVAYHLLGMTYLRLDELENAIDAFEQCSNINPKSDDGLDCTSVREGL